MGLVISKSRPTRSDYRPTRSTLVAHGEASAADVFEYPAAAAADYPELDRIESAVPSSLSAAAWTVLGKVSLVPGIAPLDLARASGLSLAETVEAVDELLYCGVLVRARK